MCAGREFQVEGADTEKTREEKLLVIPTGLVRRQTDRQTDTDRQTQTDRHRHRHRHTHTHTHTHTTV